MSKNSNLPDKNYVISPSDLEIIPIGHFKLVGEKEQGSQKGGIYSYKTSNDQNVEKQYLIKTSLKTIGVINDFVSSFILRQIIGDKAPKNHIVRLEDGKLGIASGIIPGFINFHNYFHDLGKKNLEYATLLDQEKFFDKSYDIKKSNLLDYKTAFESVEALEINLLAYFIDHRDFNSLNKGFIIEDNKIIGMTLIDFDNSLVLDNNDSLISKYPNTKYWAGIDNALKILKNIRKFDPNNLDELNSLFIELGESEYLQKIKEYIIKQLQDVDFNIRTCELAVKIIDNTISEDEYNKELFIKTFPFNAFTTPDKGNIILQSIILRNDVKLLAKLLNENQYDDLILSFNKYSTLEQKSILLSLLNDNVKKKLITQMIIDSNSEVDLKTVLNLMQVNGIYSYFYDMINKLLNNEYRNNNDLFSVYIESIYTEYSQYYFQRDALNKIKYIGIIEDKTSELKWDFDTEFNAFKLFLEDEDNYQKNFPKVINKLSYDPSKKSLVEFAEMLIANRNFDLATKILNRLDLPQLKKLMSYNNGIYYQGQNKEYQENFCTLFKTHFEELDASTEYHNIVTYYVRSNDEYTFTCSEIKTTFDNELCS